MRIRLGQYDRCSLIRDAGTGAVLGDIRRRGSRKHWLVCMGDGRCRVTAGSRWTLRPGGLVLSAAGRSRFTWRRYGSDQTIDIYRTDHRIRVSRGRRVQLTVMLRSEGEAIIELDESGSADQSAFLIGLVVPFLNPRRTPS